MVTPDFSATKSQQNICFFFSPPHLGRFLCVQVQPPDSPPCPSPLQNSLHSQSSEGSGQQDDFVMVDFVRSSSSPADQLSFNVKGNQKSRFQQRR